MEKESVVKCHALLCDIRGALRKHESYGEVERELQQIILILEDELGKDLSSRLSSKERGDDNHTLKGAISEALKWIRILLLEEDEED